MTTPSHSRQRPRLLITGVPTDETIAHAARWFDVEIWREPQPIGAQLAEAAAGMDALLVMPDDRLDAKAIDALPRTVRGLATHSVGTDQIDLAAATARGLPVFHTPDVLTDAVADLAMLLIISAARDASGAERALRAGRWTRWTPTSMMGRSLQGMRLGILGMGRIGTAIAARARPFGMVIHYHNRRRLDPQREAGAVHHASCHDLARHSDVLCLCAPATPELRGVVDATLLDALPDAAMLVNVGRGDLIDEDALFAAVRRGRLAHVATDVYLREPAIDPRWLELPRATLLPHIGSATREVRSAMGRMAVDGLASVCGGPAAGRCANPEVLSR